MKAPLIAGALLLACMPGSAHNWYDPYCCSGEDCRRIAPDDVVAGPSGYTVLGKYKVPYLDKSIKPSQDADFHACEFPAGTLRCFYVPGGGV